MRGCGSTNVGVPQGSPLSPVVFLIWMAPILENMEEKMRGDDSGEVGVGAGVAGANVGVDVELPSFVDDMCTGIIVV